MDRDWALREQAILDHAVNAVQRTAGLALRVVGREPPTHAADALLEADTPGGTFRLAAEIKTVRHFATIAMVREQFARLDGGRPYGQVGDS